MATKKVTKLDVYAFINDSVDDVAKKHNMLSTPLEDMPSMSTGILAHDIVLGGGIKPGMITYAGGEQSAKTTSAVSMMGSAVKNNLPLICFFDYEGSSSASKNYIAEVMRSVGLTLSLDEIFGKKDKDGEWLIRPLVRFRSESILENFYDFVHGVLNELPDKRLVGNQWWLVFEDNKKNKARYSDMADSTMPKKYGAGLWVPAKDGSLQAIFFTDSYPAMNPLNQERDETNNSLALQARSFSTQLPRVKGKLSQKMCSIVGINQIRQIPMAMFGPKEQEPGGQALRFYSDARIKHTSRALSAAPFSPKAGKKTFDEQELSVERKGGLDTYRYVHIKGIKNKLGTPQREAFFRIWVEDASGTARGIDPVFDTIYYLQQTGQLKGTRAKFVLTLATLGKAVKPLTWVELKQWVLGDKETMIRISKTLGYKPMSIRAFCFKQMSDGVAEKLYAAFKNANKETDDSENE